MDKNDKKDFNLIRDLAGLQNEVSHVGGDVKDIKTTLNTLTNSMTDIKADLFATKNIAYESKTLLEEHKSESVRYRANVATEAKDIDRRITSIETLINRARGNVDGSVQTWRMISFMLGLILAVLGLLEYTR